MLNWVIILVLNLVSLISFLTNLSRSIAYSLAVKYCRLVYQSFKKTSVNLNSKAAKLLVQLDAKLGDNTLPKFDFFDKSF